MWLLVHRIEGDCYWDEIQVYDLRNNGAYVACASLDPEVKDMVDRRRNVRGPLLFPAPVRNGSFRCVVSSFHSKAYRSLSFEAGDSIGPNTAAAESGDANGTTKVYEVQDLNFDGIVNRWDENALEFIEILPYRSTEVASEHGWFVLRGGTYSSSPYLFHRRSCTGPFTKTEIEYFDDGDSFGDRTQYTSLDEIVLAYPWTAANGAEGLLATVNATATAEHTLCAVGSRPLLTFDLQGVVLHDEAGREWLVVASARTPPDDETGEEEDGRKHWFNALEAWAPEEAGTASGEPAFSVSEPWMGSLLAGYINGGDYARVELVLASSSTSVVSLQGVPAYLVGIVKGALVLTRLGFDFLARTVITRENDPFVEQEGLSDIICFVRSGRIHFWSTLRQASLHWSIADEHTGHSDDFELEECRPGWNQKSLRDRVMFAMNCEGDEVDAVVRRRQVGGGYCDLLVGFSQISCGCYLFERCAAYPACLKFEQ